MYLLQRTWGLVESLGLYNVKSHRTLAAQLERWAGTQPDRAFLRFEERSFSYAQANALINQHAHAYRALGIGRNDVVALMLENRPEFLWHMFGLHKLGGIASLINPQLQAEPLAHALRICHPRFVVVGSEAWANFSSVRGSCEVLAESRTAVDIEEPCGVTTEARHWADLLKGCSSTNPPLSQVPELSDSAAYIYTSGTTGLPKAAVVRHLRLYRAGKLWAALAFWYRPDDVLYCCLPLYHSNALLLGVGSVISGGVTLALARKFSRTTFWDDIRRYEASSFIYIGELCRYLLNAEPSPRDREHRVRVISGNGLRSELWGRFRRRFGIKRVVEFYGATEGNCVTLNVLGVRGAVGLALPNMRLAQWDDNSSTFVRDAQGHLVPPKPGEPGVLLSRIRSPLNFVSYEDQLATESKVVRDAFSSGDAWFNTGDLLRTDRRWHLHFVDRLGDTYRFRGENVATSEVEAQLARWPFVLEVNVYGVSVPGLEGRAGMAAVVLASGSAFDGASLRAFVGKHLPNYAWPRFVRILAQLTTTSTLKVKKSELQKQGFDPRQVVEPLYLFHPALDAYVELTPELHDALIAGQLKM